MAARSGSMPGVGPYFVLPDLRAAMHASLICSGVSKSGSPAAKPQTSSPAAKRALAFASTASVGEGETLRAQVESGAGRLFMGKRADEMAPLNEKQAPGLAALRCRETRAEAAGSLLPLGRLPRKALE